MPKAFLKSQTPSKLIKADQFASPIQGFITFRVSRLKKIMDRYSSRALADRFGMALAEWRVLSVLYFASPASAKWLCSKLQADKSEVSRACTILVKRGLVRRDGNRKAAVFSITEHGLELHDQVMPSRQEIQAELAMALSPAELKNLYSACEKLTDFLTARLARDDAICAQARQAGGVSKATDSRRSRISDIGNREVKSAPRTGGASKPKSSFRERHLSNDTSDTQKRR